ncbi:MAG: hypothetical protein FWF28_02800 [Micrococcales bacterium]|nr:hypothetical protein [Micrococcales bacterium]
MDNSGVKNRRTDAVFWRRVNCAAFFEATLAVLTPLNAAWMQAAGWSQPLLRLPVDFMGEFFAVFVSSDRSVTRRAGSDAGHARLRHFG